MNTKKTTTTKGNAHDSESTCSMNQVGCEAKAKRKNQLDCKFCFDEPTTKDAGVMVKCPGCGSIYNPDGSLSLESVEAKNLEVFGSDEPVPFDLSEFGILSTSKLREHCKSLQKRPIAEGEQFFSVASWTTENSIDPVQRDLAMAPHGQN